MASETVEAKAARLLLAGRVQLLELTAGHGLAEVAGDTGTWRLGYRKGRWVCPCPTPQWKRCSHVAAVELVARRPGNVAVVAR